MTAPRPPGQMAASPWDIQAPYYPGQVSQIFVGGARDPGGMDAVAGDVAGAVANAMDRRGELESDTFALGSAIGDPMDLPPGPGASSKHAGPPDGWTN